MTLGFAAPRGSERRARFGLGLVCAFQWALILALVTACGDGASRGSEAEPPVRPNILLILVDDLGWSDPSFMGSDFFETPAIDRLAAEGMTFTDAYSCAGNCAPSRACLVSGMYTPRHGVFAVSQSTRGAVGWMRLVPGASSATLPSTTRTIAEALRDAGYTTGFFGKWHLGDRPGFEPDDRGFIVNHEVAPRRGETDDPKQMSQITREAQSFIGANRDGPFFAMVSHHAPHVPFEARDDLVAKYRAKPPGRLHSNVKYAAMLDQLDENVAALLATLVELGIADKTIVVFVSDNGGLSHNPQTPLRGSKGMYYDGGIRVPMVVRWPGVIPPGSRTGLLSSNVDLYPTFLELAGAEPLDGQIVDCFGMGRERQGRRGAGVVLALPRLPRNGTERFARRPLSNAAGQRRATGRLEVAPVSRGMGARRRAGRDRYQRRDRTLRSLG